MTDEEYLAQNAHLLRGTAKAPPAFELTPTGPRSGKSYGDILAEKNARQAVINAAPVAKAKNPELMEGGEVGTGLRSFVNSAAFGLPVVEMARSAAEGGDFRDAFARQKALSREADEANTKSSMLGMGAGIVGSAAMPAGAIAGGVEKGVSALAPKFPKLARMLGIGAEGAATGAATGALDTAGTDENAALGALRGATIGGGMGLLGGGLGEGIAKLAGKYGVSAATGRNPALVEKFYDKATTLKNAPESSEVADSFGRAVSETRRDLMEGGKEVKELLADAPMRFKVEPTGSPVFSAYGRAMGDEITESGQRALQSTRDDILKGVLSKAQEGTVSPMDVHNLKNTLQRMARYDDAKKTLGQRAATEAAGDIREGLGKMIPEYDTLMKDQAKRIRTLEGAGLKGTPTPEGGLDIDPSKLDAFMSQLAKGKRGTAEAVAEVEKVRGMAPGSFKSDIENAVLKHAFDTQNPNGSRNVNFYANTLQSLGERAGLGDVGRLAGSLVGFGADKVAAPIAGKMMTIIRSGEEGFSRLKPETQRVIQLALSRGPAEVIATHTELLKRDPEYRKALANSNISRP